MNSHRLFSFYVRSFVVSNHNSSPVQHWMVVVVVLLLLSMCVVVHGNRIKRRKRKEGEKNHATHSCVCSQSVLFPIPAMSENVCLRHTHTHTHTNTLTQQVHSKKKKTQALTDMISPSVRSFCSTRQNFNIKTKTNTEREREPKLFILKIKRNVSEGGWQNVAGIFVFFPSVQKLLPTSSALFKNQVATESHGQCHLC